MVTWPFCQKAKKIPGCGDLSFPWKEQTGQMVTWPELYKIRLAFVKPPGAEPPAMICDHSDDSQKTSQV